MYYSKQFKEKMINEFKISQLTRYAFTKKYNINYDTFTVWLKQANLICPQSNKIYTKEQKQIIINEYINSNITASQLAKKHKIHYKTMLRWLKTNNINIKRKQKYDKNQIEFCINLYNQLHNIYEVSRQTKISRSTISKWLKNNKISIKRKYTIEFKQKIINEYINSNKSLNYFYREYGIRHSVLTYWLKQFDIVRENIK